MDEDDLWQKDVDETKVLLEQRLGDYVCLRCKSSEFSMRLVYDDAWKIGLGDNRVVELVCNNCGFLEKHVVAKLKHQG